MQQKISPAMIGVAVVVVLILVGLIGYFSLHKGDANTAPPVPQATIQQQYQQRSLQERPATSSGTTPPFLRR